MAIIFFDTETTGIAGEDRLIQLAVKERAVSEPLINEVYKSPVPISIEAMSVHHITEKMVEGRPLFVESDEYGDLKNIFEHSDTISVAHNASFDVGMLSRDYIVPKRVICTYKVARHLDPEETLGQYKLQYLRYLLGIEVDAVAHDAMGDVLVLEGLFERLLTKMVEVTGDEQSALEEMISISSQPLRFTTVRFGKHKGKKIAEILKEDRGYLEWLLGQKKQNPEAEADWIATLEYYLK